MIVVFLVGRRVDVYVVGWMAIFWPYVWVMVGHAIFGGIDMGCVTSIVLIGILM